MGPSSRYDLSFCIPTLNFGEFIGDTLDTIIRQADERVQIVILDGGSTDNTKQVIAEKRRTFSHIKLIERERRYGIDRDILETVAQADGEFCWLFSSDDHLAPGAIAAVRRQMHAAWDVFLANIMICDRHMQPLHRHNALDVDSAGTFDWSDPAERSRYFELATTTTAFFSFISGIVVRRSSWSSVATQSEFLGTCWIIAAQLFALAQRRLVVHYEPDPLVLKRSDNDSFMAGGLVKRVALSIDGFRRMAEHYCGAKTAAAYHVSRVLKNEFTFLYLFFHKLEVEDLNDPVQFEQYLALVRRNYADGLVLDFVRRTALLAPTGIQRTLLAIYRHLKPARRIARLTLQFVRKSLAARRARRSLREARPSLPRLEPQEPKTMISYSQNCEDVLLNRLFPENHRGFYIDVGACHPISGSVTAHFYSQGWSGINIEPSCSYKHFPGERPRDVNLQLAVSNRAGSAEFHEFPETLGVSSCNREVAELAGSELQDRFTTRTVPVATLAEICRKYVTRPIDFLSIDVEGHEREVLEGADFTTFRPRALVIEATHPHTGAPVHDKWEDLLLSAGYLFACFDGLNRYYIRSEDRDLLPRLAVPANVFDKFVSHSLHASQVEIQSMRLKLETLEDLQPVSAALARRFNRIERHLPRLSNLLVRWRHRLAGEPALRE